MSCKNTLLADMSTAKPHGISGEPGSPQSTRSREADPRPVAEGWQLWGDSMINPSNMRVVDVARLLNSTSFGFVLAQARLYREFNRVGFRIGSSENPRNINLLKYIAWMFDRKHTPEETSGARSYEDRRNAERDRQAEQSLAGRDIGPGSRRS